jgi:hypothetical protein
MVDITDYAGGADGETPEFTAASREVAEAARHISRWRRRRIDRRVIRETGYVTATEGDQ